MNEFGYDTGFESCPFCIQSFRACVDFLFIDLHSSVWRQAHTSFL